jgi:glycosyltransferase involved in cell wall biosynthesis
MLTTSSEYDSKAFVERDAKLIKVCILTTSFPRRRGDLSGIFIASLTEQLQKIGVEFDLVMPYEDGCQRDEKIHGASVHRFEYWFRAKWQRLASDSGVLADLRSLSGRLQLPSFLFMYLMKARKYVRQADVIHANWTFSGFIAVILGRRYHKPIVVTVHGSDAALIKQSKVLRFITRWILRRATKVIVVSRKLKDEITSIGVDGGNIVVIYNGVNTEIFCKSMKREHTRRILWAGRMSTEKNLPTLIHAFKSVTTQMPDATLTLLGDGDRRKEIESLIAALGLSSEVYLPGFKSHTEVAEYMKQCDVFVLPSLSEGFPLTVIEAMAIGRPVVVAAVGALPEFIQHGENGYLVDPRDPGQLATTLVDLLQDPCKRQKVGESAAHAVRQLSWDQIAEKTHRVYEEVIQ